ncbi:MAG: hypothetical protein HY071_01850 [Chloroflexi bacterium]|nr:hypothetical protein [Chloroflexota bacterium]
MLAAFETALSANDWRGLYAIATTDITNTMSADVFVARADAQRATIGTTTQLQRLSVGEVQTNPAGISFVVATYAVTQLRPDGTSVTSMDDAYFVLQGESWSSGSPPVASCVRRHRRRRLPRDELRLGEARSVR